MPSRKAVTEKADALVLAQIIVQRLSNNLTDEEALNAPSALELWGAGRYYAKDQIVRDDEGNLYRIVNEISKSIESQPPNAEGMLAVYRPIVRGHEGTLEDPIPWVYGMDCRAGKYYGYKDAVYLCMGDMIPCVWAPDTAGMWQWERVGG